MTFRLSERKLVDAIGRKLKGALFARSIKSIQADGGIAHPTASNYSRGDLPEVFEPFFRLVRALPAPKRFEVVAPLFDDVDVFDTFRRVAEMASNLKELAGHVEEISRANIAGVRRTAALLGLAGASPDREGSQAAGLVRGSRRGPGDDAGGLDQPGLALVEVRSTPDAIFARGRNETLRRHLSAKVVSLDDARALAQADSIARTGFAFRRPGEDWKVIPARDNRLWSPGADPRPVEEFRGNVSALRRTLNEAARSPEPIFITHAGALAIEGKLLSFHSAVVRLGRRSTCGADMVVTDFARQSA